MRDLISSLGSVKNRGRLTLRNSPVPFMGSERRAITSHTDDVIGDRAYDAFGSVGTLFSIVNQLANAVSKAEWHLYARTSVRDKKRRSEKLTHAFLDLWNMPNPFYTGMLFRESVQQHLDLVGEGVIVLYKVGGFILEMWPVRPDRIQPVRHPTKFLTGYVYIGPDGEEVPLELDQVIHIKYPNPADPYRGMGPVQTVLNDIDASRYSAQWNRNFFVNGAQPGGVIEVDYRMNDQEFNEFLARWNAQHQGVANAHRVAVLENAVWKDTQFSMQDMQFVELRNLPRELIREAFAFPKPMLGTVDDVNRANADAGKEILAENHTDPRLARWREYVNAFLLPQFANGKSLVADYDDPTPVNHEAADRERISQTTAVRNLVLSGYHPEDAAEACGLPQMRWVGIPSPGGGAVDESQEDNESVGATAQRLDRSVRGYLGGRTDAP